MEQQNNPQQQTEDANIVDEAPGLEVLQIGDLKLTSARLRIDQLSSLALDLLTQDPVKDYLSHFKDFKKLRGACYLG